MSFVQPIISLTDDYIVIKVPRETITKTAAVKEKVKLTAENLRGILKHPALARLDSVTASHELSKLWQKTTLEHH